jgi:ribosomal protein L7/L12
MRKERVNMTNKQINEMVRFFKIATISDLSEVAHEVAAITDRDVARLQFNQLVQLVDLPRVNAIRNCDIVFTSVPENHAIPIIRLLREVLGCGLREAKDIYDNRQLHATAKVANELISQLRQMGVELKVNPA